MIWRLLLIIFLTLPAFIAAQPTISSALETKLESHPPPSYLTLNVYLNDKIDTKELEKEIEKRRIPAQERPRYVQVSLQEKATKSQTALLNSLRGETRKDYRVKERHWLINMITIEGDLSTVHWLVNSGDVEHIELADESQIVLTEPVDVEKVPKKRLSAGSEPGLHVINAHKLWALGYSGRGQKAMLLDSGVRKEHPALKDQFLFYYVPDSYGWRSKNRPYPYDQGLTHGTAVGGVLVGLDRVTKDTIGVAYNGYFMVADFSSNKYSHQELLGFFEWAFNPDGDINTVEDIPQVVNNSWVFDTQNTAFCSGLYSAVLDALESAGIAMVFGAGNSGPSPYSIGALAFLTNSRVTPFSVGSIVAYPPFPIATTSSRGPSLCVGGGSRLIKPEVVAPGIGIRSSWEGDEYVNLDGTSIAAPHVSGAVLLLKEAFPFATGQEILTALYSTAMDLGVTGEDNNYGMGLIDVKAAFDTLSTQFAPIPPVTRDYELVVTQILSSSLSYTCGDQVEIIVEVANLGNITAINPQVSLWNQNNKVDSSTLPILNSGQYDTITFVYSGSLKTGLNELAVRCDWSQTGIQEYDPINNRRIVRLDLRPELSYYAYDFDTFRTLYLNDFYLEGDDDHIAWTMDTVNTDFVGDIAIGLPFGEYLPREGQRDILYLPILEETHAYGYELSFRYFYKDRKAFFKDSLIVEYSRDCGDSWNVIFSASDTSLSTTQIDDLTNPDNWSEVIFKGIEGGLIRFVGINDFGSTLWIDDIEVNLLTGEEAIPEPRLSIHPVPATNTIQISTQGIPLQKKCIVDIVSVSGQVVQSQSFREPVGNIKLEGLASGVYVLRLTSDSISISKTFIKD